MKGILNQFSDISYTQAINEENIEILNIKFPIKNDEFHYLIIDTNLGIQDNLYNIFFVEFELCGNNKDQIKNFKEINNDNVDRESFFILNGYFHGVKVFRNDLKFTVENREFIKSIQFRLESYKGELVQTQKLLALKSNDSIGTNNSSSSNINSGNANFPIKHDFFAKVLTNTNLGIEFHKPYL